jgi:murein DD-endopeptidase MepM/ murein hydrolase activator NlpD
MRAPTFTPTFIPVHAYKERFSAPDGPNLANTIGRVLVAGGADLGQLRDLRTIVQVVGDDTAGRARALQDRAALSNVVDVHAGMRGGTAVAAQPQALGELERIKADGQATLGSPGMIAAYDQHIAPAIDEATTRITDHTLQQLAVERQAVADQTMQAAQQSAASAWQDPSRFVQGLGAVQALALEHAGPDVTDEDRSGAVRAAVGGAVANAVGQALAAGEPAFAAHIVSGWGATLSPADYQLAVARLGQAAQNQRVATIFAQAAGGQPMPIAGGNPSPDVAQVLPLAGSLDTVAIAAPIGAAVHPLAGGMVTAVDGARDNPSVQIVHPDGSSASYGGLGLAAVSPGDLVTPAHVIGSAGHAVTLGTTAPTGGAADAGALLRSAGGTAALIGATDTPRTWDATTILDRIGQRLDLSPEEQALASGLARRRMAADQVQQAAGDLAAGRAVVSLTASAPGSIAQAADLPPELTAQMTPRTLARVDNALRGAAQAATVPAADNQAALRLELLQRQDPGQFAQINLGPLIGTIHPADLSQIAASQANVAAGQAPEIAQDSRSAVLDALARHEFNSGANLPDQALPAIKSQAETLLRLNQADPSDRASVDGVVGDAIQSLVDPA